jgi:hypothetical protein
MSTSIRPLVAIDPGLNSMGWAYWDSRRTSSYIPDRVGLIKAPRKLELAPRATWIAKELAKEIINSGTRCGVHHSVQCGCYERYPRIELDFVSEFPAWHGIQLGWAAGDLQKLVFLVGVLSGFFNNAHSFTLVTPKDWKGQLPKSVVIRRLTKRFGPGATREWEKDVWDAVGIGLWKLGRF